MDKQTEVTYKMRAILVDWIAEVAMEYCMVEQTLHLAVSYVDRYVTAKYIIKVSRIS
jgi:cyclin A